MHDTHDPPLDAMLDALAGTIGTRQKVLLGELVEATGTHGFGPVILLAAAMMVLPTGMVPGVPAFMGVMLLLAAGQMLGGRRALLLPPRLYRIQLPGPALLRGIDRARPTAARLGRVIRARLTFLVTARLSLWLIAAILVLTSVVIIAVGAIPGLPFLLALHVLAIGIGLTTGDGLFVAVGYAIFAPAAWLAGWLAGLI